jgi:IS30 family transposase
MRQSVQDTLAELPPKPPRSRLEPHVELIQELRRRKWTFQQIADILAEKVSIRVTGSAVHDFLRRRNRAANPKKVGGDARIHSERRTIGAGSPIDGDHFEFSADEPLRILPKNR